MIVRLASSRALSFAIPTTVSGTFWLEGVSTDSRLPSFRWLALAKLFVSTVPVLPSASSVAFEPFSHSTR